MFKIGDKVKILKQGLEKTSLEIDFDKIYEVENEAEMLAHIQRIKLKDTNFLVMSFDLEKI